jgi:hypothetical protein
MFINARLIYAISNEFVHSVRTVVQNLNVREIKIRNIDITVQHADCTIRCVSTVRGQEPGTLVESITQLMLIVQSIIIFNNPNE